ILHRDIKSANLMVDGNGRIRVLDFGLCKHTRAIEPLAAAGPTGRELASRDDDDEPLALRAAPTVHDKRPAGSAGQHPRSARSATAEIERWSRSSKHEPDRISGTARSGALAAGLARRGETSAALQTEAGARLGTPGWASPELMNGQPTEVRSDVFSLGAV